MSGTMDIMYILMWIMLIILLFSFIRIIQGPSMWDRLLGFSLVSSKIIVIVVLFASMNDTAYLLDLAIIYALFGFISEIFIAQFVSDREKEKEKE